MDEIEILELNVDEFQDMLVGLGIDEDSASGLVDHIVENAEESE